MSVINESPSWIVAVVFMVMLGVSLEIGFRAGARRKAAGEKKEISSIFLGVMGAVLGLVALLLAFSFSMAASRYSVHKQLLVKEANAIGTCYLRASLLPDSTAKQMQGMLRSYVDARLWQLERAHDDGESAAKTEALQNELWNFVVTQTKADPHSTTNPLLVSSVNDVIDVSAEQTASYRSHIPEVITLMLVATTIVSSLLVGYAFGNSRERNHLAGVIFIVMITAVFFALLDLDRPRRGLIQVNHEALLDLKSSMRP